MEIDLTKIGMEKGRQYETIITTKNGDSTFNAAPIGVICSGKNKVVSRIFRGSHTLENILENREYFVNITHDPEIFTQATLSNLPQEFFDGEGFLRDCDACFKCEVESVRDAVKQSDPIKKKGEAVVFKSSVVDMKINTDTRALNRGFGYVVESLANFTRFDIVDDEQKKYYLERFREAERVVRKVGYKEDALAMNAIKKELMKKGYEP